MSSRLPSGPAVLAVALALGCAAPAQTTSCLLKGRVAAPDGEPIAGAAIAVPGGPGVASDGAGRFAIELTLRSGLAFDDRDLFVAAKGRVSYRLPVQSIVFRARGAGVVGRHEIELGEIRLPRGVTFRGRVRDPEGEPVAGVKVSAYDELSTNTVWNAGWGGATSTDANGRFALPGVFDKGMRIVFDAPGHYREVVRAAGIGTPLDLRLEPSGFVEGPLPEVDGRPLSSWIYVRSEFPGESFDRVRTSGARYSLGVATRGRFRVLALDDGGAVTWQSDVLTGPRADVPLRAIAAKPGGMRVRVVDAATREPLDAARVTVRWWGGDLPRSLKNHLIRQLAAAAPEARPRVPPPDPPIEEGYLAAVADGYAPKIEKVAFEAGREVEIALDAAGRIAGRVVDPAGAPIADCLVEWEPRGDAGAAPGGAMRTAADGTFAIGGLGRGRYDISAASSPLSPVVREHCDLSADARSEDLRLVLPAGVTVAGRVTGIDVGDDYQMVLQPQDSRASPDSWIDSTPGPDPWGLAGVATAAIAADGSFVLPDCGKGARELELFVPPPPRGGAPLRIPLRRVQVGDRDLALDVDGTAARPGAVTGALKVEGARVPVGRLAVLVRPAGGRGDPLAQWGNQIGRMHWQLVGGDLAFAIPLAPGAYRLQVLDCVTGVSLLRPADEIELEIAPGQTLRRDVSVQAVLTEVTFTHEGDGPALVDHFRIDTGNTNELGFLREPIPFGGGTYGSPGAYVEGRAESASFFVSPGTVHLRVDGATKMHAGSIHFGADRGSLSVEVESGESARIELQVAPPVDLGQNDR